MTEKFLQNTGFNNYGEKVESLQSVWKDSIEVCKFYENACNYWSNVENSVDGVLGGFGSTTKLDLATSAVFLTKTYKALGAKLPKPRNDNSNESNTNKTIACDCGAGVGRIAEGLLSKFCEEVHLVEQENKFLLKAQLDLGHLGYEFICIGLQDFVPKPNTYKIIWIQWVTGHLTDNDFIKFLKRCSKALVAEENNNNSDTSSGSSGGGSGSLIVLKENICSSNFVLDSEDSSITRSEEHLKQIFADSDLTIVAEMVQPNWPKDLFTVKMFALQPKS